MPLADSLFFYGALSLRALKLLKVPDFKGGRLNFFLHKRENCYNPPMEDSAKKPEKKKIAVIPRRRLGRTGVEVSILGLGGEGVLRTHGREADADRLINTAIDLGVNYMESASAYDCCETYYGRALKGRREKIFLAGKSHARDKEGARKHLSETLKKMKTDYLDLWQIHDVRSTEDVERIFGPGGAAEAFLEAKEKGHVRFLGVTGHEEPSVIKKCIEVFDFDTVLIPVNPAEPTHKPFIDEVAPIAGAKDMGIVGMKVYLRGRLDAPKKLLFCYALTQPLSTAVIGCDTVEQLEENVEIAASFMRLKLKEVERVTAFISPYARELMYYKP
ncbi:MAG: aldo/keto reductase [Thermodesulfobacteriota bacterium]|nr:MAG: aldo/keto reductase [Thermodesulfobacteriota bacterium]